MRDEDYAKAAAQFHESVIADLEAAHGIHQWLADHFRGFNATLADWRDSEDEGERDDYAELAGHVATLDLWLGDVELGDITPGMLEESLTTWRHEYGYGLDIKTVVRVTLAGGGPAGWLDLTYSKDDRGHLQIDKAEVAYCDWFQTPLSKTIEDPEMVEAVLGIGDYLE